MPEENSGAAVIPFVPPELQGIKFGVEIETLLPSRDDYQEIVDEVEGWTIPSDVHGDGSISGNGYGIEIATPPLTIAGGGKEYIETLCEVLQDRGAFVNRSCGLHVHIDGTSIMRISDKKKLFAMYIAFEDVLESFVPASRRNNRYSGSFRSRFALRDVIKVQSTAALERLWYSVRTAAEAERRKEAGKYDDTRYHYLNMHSLFSAGHYEIRSHSGTRSARKILEWVRLQLYILRAVKRVHESMLVASCEESDIEVKTRVFFDNIQLPEDARQYFLQRQSLFRKEPQAVEITDEVRELTSEDVVPN